MSAPAIRLAALRRLFGKPARLAERIFGGGLTHERVLPAQLGSDYASRFRRECQWSTDPPDFFDHRLGAFDLAFRPPAVVDPLPQERCDVIVCGGASGHFGREAAQQVLAKIADELAPEGAFRGSELLSSVGYDHLQFFPDLEALHRLLSVHFPHVWLRDLEYSVRGRPRREALWRCAKEPTHQQKSSWLAIASTPRAAP